MHIPTASARRDGGRPEDAARYALRRTSSREDWAAVRALRFAALSRRGDIPAGAVPTYGDSHDTATGAFTYLLRRGGTPVGSTRSSFATPGAAWPSLEAFALDIRGSLAGASLVEASLTVVDPDDGDPTTATLHLFKAHMLECAARGADWLVTAVRDTQIGFYRRVLDMEILTGTARVAGMALPRVLMGLRMGERAARLFERLPILDVTPADRRELEASGEVPLRGLSAP